MNGPESEEVFYQGYTIRARVSQVGPGHEAHGKWVAGESTIGRQVSGGLAERSRSAEPTFHNDKDDAVRRTLASAKALIDSGKVD